MTFLLETVRLALTNLRLHMLRSILTALGIILGVSAVILMSSISEGKMREVLSGIEALGAKNIIVRSQLPAESNQAQGQQRGGFVARYGLTRNDVRVIRANFPEVETIVPLKQVGGEVAAMDRRMLSQAFGTTPDFLRLANLRLSRGRYLTQADLDEKAAVAVVGHEVIKLLYPQSDPLGSTLRIDGKSFVVVGVLSPVGLAGGAGAALIGRNLDLDVHIPMTNAEATFGDMVFRSTAGSRSLTSVEVSELYMLSLERERVMDDSARLHRILAVRQSGLNDVTVQVPYQLLEKAKDELRTGRTITAAIAGIALLVGGIGIMNIMLASVTERTREIGIRRALGATRQHITWQFLVESSALTCIGGLIGVGLGVGGAILLPLVVPHLHELPLVGQYMSTATKLPTAISPLSIIISFTVAAITGLIFGIYPARKAAKQDPIVALRHD